MKYNNLIFCILILLLSSCNTVLFETSQPKNAVSLSRFPKELVGIYKSKDVDTVVITDTSYSFLSFQHNGQNKTGTINSETTVLKKAGDYYILNLKSIDTTTWDILAFKQNGQTIKVFYILIDNKNEEHILSTIKSITNLKVLSDSSAKANRYFVNPTDEEFMKLLDSKVFSKILDLKKIK